MDTLLANLNAGIVIFDKDGVILEVNPRAEILLGGSNRVLAGKNILDFYPDYEKPRIKAALAHPNHNCFTYEKNDMNRMVYQLPWYRDGSFRGFIEFILEVPMEIPHFVRR